MILIWNTSIFCLPPPMYTEYLSENPLERISTPLRCAHTSINRCIHTIRMLNALAWLQNQVLHFHLNLLVSSLAVARRSGIEWSDLESTEPLPCHATRRLATSLPIDSRIPTLRTWRRRPRTTTRRLHLEFNFYG